MNTSRFVKPLAHILWIGFVIAHSLANAASGYMAFLANGPAGTTVRAGDAASYMRAGTDWDGATVVAGVATPTLLQASTITTWREDGTALRFRFVIPDRTTTASGATLACGDQVIVQIGPANTAATALQQGQEFRFEVVIQDNLISGGVKKRLPNPPGHPLVGRWKAAAEAATTASATLSTGGNQYTIDLTIPLSEINNPASDLGLALAIVNDLGHSHGSPAINEASGTAFPVGMGLTPESDPGLTCGAPTSPSGETATGNWINPSTWGVGYFSAASVPLDVTLDQAPQFTLSRATRLGRCSILNFGDIAEVTSANWESIQQNVANNWYLYNPDGPCRMTIWINATVAGTGIVRKRFFVLWGRPGISPEEWYVAGLTEPVAISGPSTPVSFIWNDVPPVAFSSHPCLRVYVLPDALTPAQIAALQGTPTVIGGVNVRTFTSAQRTAMETDYSVAQGSMKSAQMNFANIGTGSCTEAACRAVISSNTGPERAKWPDFSVVGEAIAADRAVNPDRGDSKAQVPGRPGERKADLVRIVAHAFGVAAPAGTKRYVYVEFIGGLGWAVPNDLDGQQTIPLPFDVANPKIAERMIVGGKAIDIASPPRRVLVSMVTTAVSGTPVPKIDTSSLGKFAETPMQPGAVAKTQITLRPAGGAVGDIPWWGWLLIAILIVVLLIVFFRRPSTS